MRTRFAPLACLTVLLTVAVLGGCTPDAIPPNAPPAPEVAAALDWAEAADMEFGAAPWSPPGWPLKVGDRISRETLDDLGKRFSGGWLNGMATNWVDDLPFGALILGGNRRDVESETPHVYHGHFPRKVSDIYKPVMWDFLPPHLQGRNVDHLFREPGGIRIFEVCPPPTPTFRCQTVGEAREHWHGPWLGEYGDGGKGGGP
ncbi:MAG: hypothetical protein OXP70_14215 [Acidobacteriota bacterium]|nr:hypothetical protein [Acidobacteriota bacterium]